MSSSSNITSSFSQLLPSQRNLSELLEKLLTVFGVESILEGKALPSQPLQREADGTPRYVLRPMDGNDFHVQTSFGTSPSWKAQLQLEQDDQSDKIFLPLCDVAQHPASEQVIKQLAKTLRAAWPDRGVVGPSCLSKRRQLGPPFIDPEAPDYKLFRWLASKDLNPAGEGVSLIHLYRSADLLYQPLRQKSRGLVVKSSTEAEWIEVDARPSAQNNKPGRPDGLGAQIWSFTGPDQWVISLPVLATILLLMTHPAKQANPLADNPDRDLSWTLDSLHGFCRKEDLEEGNRHLSWSLGTYPDRWMYLNFIFHYFTPCDDDDAGQWLGSGIRCDRRTITIPIGEPNGKESFREQRVWFGMRTATGWYEDHLLPDEAKLKGPTTIAFVLYDSHHHPVRMTKKDWTVRGLEAVPGASGITAFQMLLWGGVDEWSEGWNACLDYIDRLHHVKVEDIDSSLPDKLHNRMFDPSGYLAKDYFVTAHLLKIFGRHIDVLPRSLRQIRSKWETTYPGVDSDLTQRFGEVEQQTLLSNWTRLIDHADSLHGKLAERIDKMSRELLNLRDSLMIAKNAIR